MPQEHIKAIKAPMQLPNSKLQFPKPSHKL